MLTEATADIGSISARVSLQVPLTVTPCASLAQRARCSHQMATIQHNRHTRQQILGGVRGYLL